MSDEKKKSGLALLIGVGKKPAMKDEPDGDEEDGGEDYSAAVDELFDALKSGDREAFNDAFKAAVMSCK